MKIDKNIVTEERFELAKKILNTSTQLYLDKPMLQRIHYYYLKKKALLKPTWKYFFGDIEHTNKVAVRNKMIDNGIDQSLFIKKSFTPSGTSNEREIIDEATGRKVYIKYSTDANQINFIESVVENPELKVMIDVYKQMAEIQALEQNFAQYRQLPIAQQLSFEEHEMYVATPKYHKLVTYRLGAYEPSLQNVKRELQCIYTSPYGYLPVFADSGQIEPKIIYSHYIPDKNIQELIKLYDDAYYGLYHFVFGDRTSREKMTISKEDRNKLKLWGNKFAYGGHPSSNNNDEIQYYEAIGKHPLRQKWEEDVVEKLRAGVRHFPNFFGINVHIGSNESKYSGFKNSTNEAQIQSYMRYLTSAAINNPIQSTASYLMCESVIHMDKMNDLLGMGAIGYYKHDEVMMHVKADKVDTFKQIVADSVAYEVDGLLPIKSDLQVGRKALKMDGI